MQLLLSITSSMQSRTRGGISRNNVLYANDTGLVDVASDVKSYVKSVYGASSPQYKQVSKLGFKALRI